MRPVPGPAFGLPTVAPQSRDERDRAEIVRVDRRTVQAELEMADPGQMPTRTRIAVLVATEQLVLLHQRGNVPYRIANRHDETRIGKQALQIFEPGDVVGPLRQVDRTSTRLN